VKVRRGEAGGGTEGGNGGEARGDRERGGLRRNWAHGTQNPVEDANAVILYRCYDYGQP